MEVLREVLAGVLWEIAVLRGVLPRVLRESGGAAGNAPEGAQCGGFNRKSTLPGAPPVSLSTLGSTPEHPPKDFPVHFQGFPS